MTYTAQMADVKYFQLPLLCYDSWKSSHISRIASWNRSFGTLGHISREPPNIRSIYQIKVHEDVLSIYFDKHNQSLITVV